MKAHSLEDLQDMYSTFRRRAEPGLTRGDILTRMAIQLGNYEEGFAADLGAALGELLIDLCCLAQAERLDLAHHARRAFRRMQDEYEEGR